MTPKEELQQPPQKSQSQPPEKKKDALELHYVFQTPFVGNVPRDFETNKETGHRKGLSHPPSGVVKHVLVTGIEGATLPPLATWRTGKWVSDLTKDSKEALMDYVKPHDPYVAYAVTGEFTPGNYLARIYILPKTVASEVNPLHPSLWSESLQKGSAVTSYTGSSYTAAGWGRQTGFHSPSGLQPVEEPKTKLPPPPKAKPVPMNVRYRCGGCGHWFKENDLAAHATHCCPGIKGDDSDWAILCECCDTLDEVSKRKPGFPRPIKKKKPVATKTEAVAAEDKPEGEEEKDGNDGNDDTDELGEGEEAAVGEPPEVVESAD